MVLNSASSPSSKKPADTLLPVIILDRDGVINKDSKDYIKSPREWEPLPGSIDAIVRLQIAGYRVFIATNQSGLGRGLFSEDTLMAMHQKMQDLIIYSGGKALAGIYFCPHLPTIGCECRKPKPGMLKAIERDHGVVLSNCYYVGDSHKDLLAADEAGAQGVLVLTGNGHATLEKIDIGSRPVFPSLEGFVASLL